MFVECLGLLPDQFTLIFIRRIAAIAHQEDQRLVLQPGKARAEVLATGFGVHRFEDDAGVDSSLTNKAGKRRHARSSGSETFGIASSA